VGLVPVKLPVWRMWATIAIGVDTWKERGLMRTVQMTLDEKLA
jgi:hypothetical protein